MHHRYIGDKAFYRRVFGVAVPIIIQNGITNFVSLLDNIMVGQVGTVPMSGVSIVNGLLFVFNLCVFGASSGAGIFTAQFYGSKDDEGIRHTFRFKFLICIVISLVGAAIFLLGGSSLIGLYLTGEGDAATAAGALDHGLKYLAIMLWGFLPFALTNTYSSTLRETGETFIPMLGGIAAVFVNLVLNYILIFGKFGAPEMGVEGAAIATFISQLVGGVLPVFYFIDRSNSSRLHLCKTSFYSKVLRDACINGSSELMTNLSMSLVNILYNYQLLRLAGENGVAAYGVIMYAAFLFVAVFVGYAVGSAPIVSFHYGARNHAEVHNLYRKSLRLIAVVAVTLTLASMFIIPCVARIFVGYDAELLALTSRAFRLYALSFLIMGFNVYASSFFTALGDGVTSALISFLRTLAFQVIAILLLPLLLGIDGIWLAVTAAELAALAVSAAMLLTKDKVFHYRKA